MPVHGSQRRTDPAGASNRSPGCAGDGIRRFSILARYSPMDSIAFGYLQLLGMQLVWHLHRVGALSPDAANTLLRRWCAAEVSARESGRP